jgi:hypothetical protein
MHFDRRRPESLQRRDFQLLRDSPLNLYWRRSLFNEEVDWLKQHGYRVELIDLRQWRSAGDEQTAIAKVLSFPTVDYGGGGNWDSWRDWMMDLDWLEEDFLAVGLLRFDVLLLHEEARARTLLELLSEASRHHLLLGRHLVVLAQSDDSSVALQGLDPVWAKWNAKEWWANARWPGPPPSEPPPSPPIRVPPRRSKSP